MPRKAAPSTTPSTPVEDPLADLREEGDRYGEQQGPGDAGSTEADQGPTEGPNALETVILARLEAAMAIPLDPEGVITDDHRAMAQALATEMAEELAPLVAPVQDLTWEAAVEVWHEDTVCLGFLHKGGRCGCRYIAQRILGA